MREFLLWLWWLGSRSSPLPILSIGAAILLCIQLHRYVEDVDIFWQVKLGEITLKQGLPAHEPFLINQENDRLATVAWLGQAVYAAVKLAGGWQLLRFFDAVIWFAGFVLVARQAARQAGNDWPALAGLLLGWYAAVPHASLRPQSWAVGCFGLLLVLVRGNLSNRAKVVVGLPLLIVWQNLHPSVVLGIGYLAVFAAVSWLRKAPTRQAYTVLLIGALAATLCTPQGAGIFAISKYNEEISKERHITEWLPMYWWPMQYGRDNSWIGFALLAEVLILAGAQRVLFGRWRLRLDDFLCIAGLTAVTLLMHRFVLFWGVAVVPLVATVLAVPATTAPPRHRARRVVALVAFAGAIAPPMSRGTHFVDYYPFQGVKHLRGIGFEGNIYSNYFFGGVIVEENYPAWKVSHDGRYYLFPRQDWKQYDDAADGRVPVETLLERFKPKAFFLRKKLYGYPEDEGLIAVLRRRWRVEYEDELCVIFLVPP